MGRVSSSGGAPGAIRSIRSWWARAVVPTAVGLPNGRIVAAGLLLLFAAWLVLVITSINGTSSGAFYPMVYPGNDPALLLGSPNLIRTDEWNVQTVWAIAQYQQGLPAVNETFPGGMDATIPQDLPRVDWSAVFRPHLWGFWISDVGHAQAWKWWLPLLGVAAAGYLFVLVLLPARPLTAMIVALSLAASPFFQWWLLQTTLWPVAWGLAVLAGVIWLMRSESRRALWVWLPVIAYLTVVMGMGIYVPFILPVAVVVAFAAVGVAVQAARERGWRLVVGRSLGVVGAGAAGGVVLAVWLATRWDAVTDFLSTAYPGERLEATGARADFRGAAALLGSTFTNSLKHAGTFLDGNASESVTFFLPGLFLAPVVGWLIWRRRRDGAGFPWAVVLTFAGAVVLVAFILVPGWDAIAHLLLLDRTTAGRARIGLGFASFVVTAMLLAEVTRKRRPGWLISLIGPAVFVAVQGGIAWALSRYAPHLLSAAGVWLIIAAVSAAAILAVARGWRGTAAVLLLAVSVAGSHSVNPLYLGVFDLRETAPSQAIQELDAKNGGTWVGVGDRLTTAILLESGVEAFNGFQGAPNGDMWDVVDPDARYEYEWNRLAGVSWTLGDGEPVVSNPYPDQISVTFDPCSDFAQENVEFVLTDQSATPDGSCLRQVETFDLNQSDLTIWQVLPSE